jgi:hypothetical protein
MRPLCGLLVLPAALLLSGCHSAFVEATISNRTPQRLQLIEVDYPSASFGTQTLDPGADFHYRFKVLGEGKLTLSYTDAANKEQKSSGPEIQEGAEGPLRIIITPSGTEWQNKTAIHH